MGEEVGDSTRRQRCDRRGSQEGGLQLFGAIEILETVQGVARMLSKVISTGRKVYLVNEIHTSAGRLLVSHSLMRMEKFQ